MNIAKAAINNNVTTLTLSVLILIGGYFAYEKLGRLEDPEFTIKDVLIFTQYPGATPEQVRKQVTIPIEDAAQKLDQMERVTSRSEMGLSVVTVTIKDKYNKGTLQQVFDELRRKIGDVTLPKGASTPFINDDFGDVYGIFLAFTGIEEGYSKEDFRKYADFLQQELLLVKNVKKVSIFGAQPEVIYVEISREKLSLFNIPESQIYSKLEQQNLIQQNGSVLANSKRIPIEVSGELDSVKALGNIMLTSTSEGHTVKLKDIATIKRGYVDPAKPMLRYQGKFGIGLGISVTSGGNVVELGKNVKQRLKELESSTPVGIKMHVISMQSDYVTSAINSFVSNLGQAVAIVIIVLLIFMGLRSGLIIGSVLVLTISGTMIFMFLYDINLQRISLGALIIALGMLVDNAIVITDGILVQIQHGHDRKESAIKVVRQNQIPLLGATAIAILAFAAIGTSQDSTGEFCGSLFYVLMISLGFSWVTAITITPLLCIKFLKVKPPKKQKDGSLVHQDPHAGPIYKLYRAFLKFCLRKRIIPIACLLILLVSSIVGFGQVKKNFFPASTRGQFLVDVWLPFGTDIEYNSQHARKVEKYLQSFDHVTDVTSFIGSGGPRFILTYAPERADTSYSQFLVSVDNYNNIDAIAKKIQAQMETRFPETMVNVKKFQLGPSSGGKIQLRLRGPDTNLLRELAEQTKAIMRSDPESKGIYTDWRNMRQIIVPEYLIQAAEQAGITRDNLEATITRRTIGQKVGIYREGKRQIPIIARPPSTQANSVDELKYTLIFNPTSGQNVPIEQVVDGFSVKFDNGIIMQRNRVPTITVHCDPTTELPSQLLARLMPRIEKMFKDQNLTSDYQLQWGGEYEDSRDAQGPLMASMPIFGMLMAVILIMLFNALRQPVIILLTVPLAVIGVTAGLLIMDQPFGFMALLGMLSLSGMLIKNSIVLIDQTDLEIREGKDRYLAVVDSAVSRARPVMMATATTVLGMLPLARDPFYVSMAVTIMFGLTFAAILTLIAVPVFYAVFFKIKSPRKVVTAKAVPKE